MAEQRYKIGALPTRNTTTYTTTTYLTVTFRQLEIVNIGNNVYQSLVDNNVGNELTDTSKWVCLVDNDAYIAAEATRQESFNESEAARTETFNENEAERQAAIDAKLAEINAMEFDVIPTFESIKAAKSGGIYDVLVKLGSECSTSDDSETTTAEGQQGQWQTDGTIGTTAAVRAHLKISAKGRTSLQVTAPSDYYFTAYEVDDDNASVGQIVSDFQAEATFQVSGEHDVMLNIKYQSAGTTTITTSMLSGKEWTIVKKTPSLNFEPAAPNSDFVEVKSDVETINDTLFSQTTPQYINNENASSQNYSSYSSGVSVTRGYYLIDVQDFADYTLNVNVANDSPIKVGIQGWTRIDYTSYVYDSGWQTGAFSVGKSSTNDAKYIALVTTFISGNTGIPTFSEFLQYITFSMEYTESDGLVARVGTLEAENATPKDVETSVLWDSQLTTAKYTGAKIDLSDNSYTYTNVGSLQSGTSSRQGGALYGNYLFQFHNTLATVCVFDLSTGTNVNKITMTAMANCHAGSGGFSNTFYDANDPFPLLYVSSMDERKIYVYRITGSVGSLVMTKIQTITLSTDYYLPNITIDADNNKIVIFAYTQNSWSSPTGNKSVIMSCNIPSYSADVTISEFENTFFLPFIYAEQGAWAQYGILYLSYGNTGQTQGGGIIVIDYINKYVRNLIGLLAIGSIEPEACCKYGNSIVVTTQNGAVYKLEF